MSNNIGKGFLFLVVSFFLFGNMAEAAGPYTFRQFHFGSGTSTTIANHTNNQTYWTYYASSASTTVNGGGIKLNSTPNNYPVGPSPRGVAFDPITNSVWVANGGDKSLTKLNPTDGSTRATIQLSSICGVNCNLTGIDFEPYSNSIWVGTNSNNVGIIKIDPSTGNIIGNYLTNPSQQVIIEQFALDPITNSIWVMSGSNLTKMNPIDGSVLAQYNVESGNSTNGLFFHSATNSIWFTKAWSNSIFKVDATNGAILASTTVGPAVYGIGFDEITNRILVSTSVGIKTVNPVDTSLDPVQIYPSTWSACGGEDKILFESYTNSVWHDCPSSWRVSKYGNQGGVPSVFQSASNQLYAGIAYDSFTHSLILYGLQII